MALNIPSQTVYALNPPDAQGRWQFALTDQIAVTFRRNAAGEVVALNMIYEVERVEFDVEADNELFTLRPRAAQ